MTAPGPTRLYAYWRSSASWRVRIALNCKGVAYETVPVHLVRDGGEQRRAEYRAVNPAALVPSLEIDGVRLSESLAIVDYLEQTRPTPSLYPAAAYARAQALRIAELVNAGTQPLQNLRVLQYLESELGADAAGQRRWAAHWIGMGLEAIEAVLADTAGAHAVGDAVTVADVCLVPQVYNARRFGVDLAPFPRVVAAEAAAGALAPFAAAVPERQPDAV
ncbi:MAG: maleylacetoacetate isomerase [Myxococcales bacterium]|nr:maleylacetoacetate isomerase [Myxococcales bacterium]MCB9519626.1 maleylacetoacetate isomerase [Myxococcales bacterium]MCB9530650.1 maleylacetoacetate isomerase [Myxococcales bacterium]